MKTLPLISLACAALCCLSCLGFSPKDAYPVAPLVITMQFDEGYGSDPVAGLEVLAENMSNGAQYRVETNAGGEAVFQLVPGLYRVSSTVHLSASASDHPKGIYSGSSDKIRFTQAGMRLSLTMMHVETSPVLIKEIYCGGCKKLPQEGEYQSDKYMIVHNNSEEDYYLDSLCVGVLAPYNATGNNHWAVRDGSGTLVFKDYAPVIQAVWQFPGGGRDFCLKPGADAVLCFCGAIDHTANFPLSVNLDKEDYFVCYNNKEFYNTQYHPVPGSHIRSDHYMNLVIKLGKANAYTVSVSSPAIVLFRTKGVSIGDFVADDSHISLVPGSADDRIVCLPWAWILDGVEVFTPASNNVKRLSPAVDVGYVTLSETFMQHTLMRRVNQEATAVAGYEVLADSNNSSADFYQRDIQSLHE